MDYSVENINGLLIRSKLLSPEEVRGLYDRWRKEGKDKQKSTPHFLKWMVANKYVTEYQAGLLSRGHADDFFLGDYKVLDRLGKGRMAGVYKAVHKLGQTVAIKVLPPSHTQDAELLARFERESRLAMQLKHPNVVRSFQVGATGELRFIVMEYLEGETLEDVLNRRKKLPLNEAVRLMYQTLQGLQHIHEKGFIHRDIKPGNLMLVPSRVPGEPDNTLMSTVKILDIGLGREFFEENAKAAIKDLELTGEGVLLGTPDYLAPEQARDPRKIDIRADIYSVGCVLYHCLAGQPPFPDTNVLNQMVRHATEEPKPVKEFTAHVPDGLQQVLNWMMAKDPTKRYPSPERAAQAMQLFLVAGAPARPIEESPKMRKYLTYLETGKKADGKQPAKATPAAKATHATDKKARAAKPPSAKPVAVPVTKDLVPEAKTKRDEKRDKKQAKTSKPQSLMPAAPVPMNEIDVELVTVPEPPTSKAAARSLLGKFTSILSKRDWILVGIGAVAVVGAVAFGWLLAQIF